MKMNVIEQKKIVCIRLNIFYRSILFLSLVFLYSFDIRNDYLLVRRVKRFICLYYKFKNIIIKYLIYFNLFDRFQYRVLYKVS